MAVQPMTESISAPSDKTPRPALRWAGSKRRLVPQLLENCPISYNRYFEPFAGSAVFYLALNPKRATISDLNPHVINLYRNIARHPGLVGAGLNRIPTDKATYYQVRARFMQTEDALQNAIDFLYLNRLCFNGIYRTSREGKFNVPYGSRLGPLPTVSDLQHLAKRLRRTRLRCADYRSVLDHSSSGDFAYLDPPYFESQRNPRGEYGYGSFRQHDIGSLIMTVKELDQRGVQVLLSYKDDETLRSSLSRWRAREVQAGRFVAANASNRKQTTELLVSNF